MKLFGLTLLILIAAADPPKPKAEPKPTPVLCPKEWSEYCNPTTGTKRDKPICLNHFGPRCYPEAYPK